MLSESETREAVVIYPSECGKSWLGDELVILEKIESKFDPLVLMQRNPS